ncbi:MAG: uracil phosphoribosyltransferase [Cyclobacteriaceae bacterium]|nr:uracil phosphoribosyltransferase [Cyclobacteriaceae bacterium]UYN86477.1 MAG: uracil phosphoribosyltransferase [Cyclobacteriaceae bacterium]
MTFILNQTNSIANSMLKELRDKNLQQDRTRFRNNVQKLGSILAYEISKQLSYRTEQVETPLGTATLQVLSEFPVLITVLRAGLPFFQGFQYFFHKSDGGFIGAYRKENGEDITINLAYLAAPDLSGKQLIIIDPMLATGKSFVKSIEALMKHGKPTHVHIASLVAAPEGIAYLKEKLTLPYSVYTCALDEKLNTQSYIVPGLGDAGDLCYGEKI